MSNKSRKLRSALLTGASTAFLAGISATAAYADPATTTVPSPSAAGISTVAHVSATSGQSTDANVEAEVSGVLGGIDGLIDDGASSGSTNTVSANTLHANAIGNTYSGSVDLALVTAAIAGDDPVIDPDAHGAAALSVQLVDGSAVTSLASDNTLSIDRPGFESGSVTAEGNSIEASTTVNRANQTIAGVVPSGFVSEAAGVSSLDYPAGTPVFEAQGTVVASTLQLATDAGASATALGNTVALDLTADEINTVTAAPVLDNNSIAAATTVNAARTTIDLQEGADPTFTGSAVVSNVQSNFATTATTLNAGSSILATIEGNLVGDGDVNTLNGALSVAGNSISSSVSGNDVSGATPGVAGNRILIGDGLSFSGSGAASPGSAIAYDDGDLEQTATADLIINNSQNNVGDGGLLTLSAETVGFQVLADVQSLNDGSITVTGNTASAASTGNRASGAIASGEGAQGFEGSVAVANQQTNYNVDQTASLSGGVIASVTGTNDGVTQGSSISVAENTASATGYGNSASHSIALAANTLDIGTGAATLSGGTDEDGNVTASGGATIANLQSSYNSDLTVTHSGTQIGLDADSRGTGAGGTILSGNTLSVSDNTQEAVGLVNSATNTLSLESNDVGSGAGIASVQIFGSNSSVSSALTGSRAGVVASTHVDGSEIEASGNLQRALAYGGSVSNRVTVDSNSPTLPTSAGPASQIAYDAGDAQSFSDDDGALPTVTAAFGILNDQSSQGDVSALASGTTVGVAVEGDVSSSTVRNIDNAFVAAAYGNDAVSRAVLDIGNVSTADFASVAAVSNTQAAGDAGSSITATVTGGDVVTTAIEDDVDGSSVSTSNNTIQALAYGNRSTGNTVTVTGNNIDTASADPIPAGVSVVSTGGGDLALAATASFAVQNAQAAHGVISASQLDDPDAPTTAAGVLTTIGTVDDGTGDVSNSTVVSNGNRSLASVTGNSAVSGVSVSGNELATTTGVQNFQVSDAVLSAGIGLAGADGADGGPFSYVVTGIGLSHDSEEGELTGGTLFIDTTALGSAEIAFLLGTGWALSGPNELSRDAAGYTADVGEYGLIGTTGLSVPAVAPDLLGQPNAGGVRIAVNGDISASTLAVDTNTVAGSVIGNNATNTLAVTGTSVASGSGLEEAVAGAAPGDMGATADHALSNLQSANGGSLVSDVYATFALDAVEGVNIDNATLSVSGNSQSATAVANTAGNGLALSANEIAAGSALSSVQGANVSVSALSDAELFAPAAVNASSVSISDNTNASLAVVNDVTNSATVSGTSVAALDSTAVAVLSGEGPTSTVIATGDHVLANFQSAVQVGDPDAPTVSSVAVTRLYNEDSIDDTGLGLRDSSLTFAGNSTGAEASANRATNSLVLNGASSQAASAGVANLQSSGANVEAVATSTVAVSLAGGTSGDPQAAVSGSSVTIGGNTTSALARGNAATNALNVEAGAGYVGRDADTTAGSSLNGAGLASVGAQAAVLNQQGNSGDVLASSTEVAYGAVLNAGALSPAVVSSTVSIAGNVVSTEAYGNTARNSLTLTALNTGVPTAAIGNYQVNSGAIRAEATSVTFGIQSFGGNVGASSLRTTGNQITATAVGNSAVSTVAAQ